MHHYRCNDKDCDHLHQQYHSCGNRHCPNCGGLKKEQWIENLTAQLFPTAYYHVVFTVAHEPNNLIPAMQTGQTGAGKDSVPASVCSTHQQGSRQHNTTPG